MPLSLGNIILLKEKGGMRESIPRWVDKKSRVPEERKGFWGSQGGEKDKHFFFSTLPCISQYNNVSCWRICFSFNKNLLTNLAILKLVYCGSGFGKTFLLLVLILLI